MKKFLQKFFCYSTRPVTDADTLKPQIAVYYMIFGIVVKTTYKMI